MTEAPAPGSIKGFPVNTQSKSWWPQTKPFHSSRTDRDYLKFIRILSDLSPILPVAKIIPDSSRLPHHSRYIMFIKTDSSDFLCFSRSHRSHPTIQRLLANRFRTSTVSAPNSSGQDYHKHNGQSSFEFGFDFDTNVIWPIIKRSTKDKSIVFLSGSQKRIAFHIDQKNGHIQSVIKIPDCEPTALNCKKELSLLAHLQKHNLKIAPRPQSMGALDAPGRSRPLPYTVQQFLPGARPKCVNSADVASFLSQLRLKDEVISLNELARELEIRLTHVELGIATKEALFKLLKGVNDTTALPASITHGDLRPANLMEDASARLSAVDWEFCHRKGLELLDFTQLILERKYSARDTATFADVFQRQDLRLIELYAEEYINGPTPPLSELVTLQFAQHFIDRFIGFDRIDTDKLRRLALMARTDLPF